MTSSTTSKAPARIAGAVIDRTFGVGTCWRREVSVEVVERHSVAEFAATVREHSFNRFGVLWSQDGVVYSPDHGSISVISRAFVYAHDDGSMTVYDRCGSRLRVIAPETELVGIVDIWNTVWFSKDCADLPR